MVKGTKGSTVRGVKDPSILTIKQRVIQVTAPTNSIRLLEEGGGVGWDLLGQSPAPLHKATCRDDAIFSQRSRWDKTVGLEWLGVKTMAQQKVTENCHYLPMKICTCTLVKRTYIQ